MEENPSWCQASGIDDDGYFWRCTRAPDAAFGLCGGHYQQQKAGRPFAKLRKKGLACGFVGCDGRHHARGWCSGHLRQLGLIHAGRLSHMTPLTRTKPRTVGQRAA